MELVQANLPIEPAAGQAIGFPIPNIRIGDSVAFIQLYREVFSATASARQADQNWDPAVLTRSAVGLTIAAHAAMLASQTLFEIFVRKSDIVTDLKKEDLACAKDLICILDDCQGQKEVTDPATGMISAEAPLTPTCLTVSQTTHVVARLTVSYIAQEPRM
jgi:proline racemase